MMRRLFAALYDTVGKGSEEAGLREERRQLLAGAEGEVVELGAAPASTSTSIPSR